MSMSVDAESKYLNLLIQALRRCREYRPRFGSGSDLSLEDFQNLYRADAFYSWFGCDTLQLQQEQLQWYYIVRAAGGGERKIYLDAELDIADLQAGEQRQSLSRWLQDARDALQVTANIRGVVFKVRQGSTISHCLSSLVVSRCSNPMRST